MAPAPLQAVGGEAPRSLGDHFSEVLFSMNRNCVGLLARWLEETLQDPTFPSTLVSVQQKDAFRQQLLRYVFPTTVALWALLLLTV